MNRYSILHGLIQRIGWVNLAEAGANNGVTLELENSDAKIGTWGSPILFESPSSRPWFHQVGFQEPHGILDHPTLSWNDSSSSFGTLLSGQDSR